MLAATPLGALQPRVSFRSFDKPAASHHGSRPRASKLEPVVPPSFGSNARCFGGDALISLLVPDALLIAAVNCRITARLRPPTLRFRCAGPTALLVTPPRHVVVSAASPDAAVRLSVIDEERKRWKNMKRCPESADTVKVRLI